MEEFSPTILESLKSRGYKFILYHNLEHFALITPMFEECAPNEHAYIIPMNDEQTLEMAQGVDGFVFYVGCAAPWLSLNPSRSKG